MDEKQMTKGREAYQMMDEACNQLVKSGNWQRVGSSAEAAAFPPQRSDS